MERQPVHFMNDLLPSALAQARDRLADFVHAPRNATHFVGNATEACAAVLRSIPWKAGDRVVLANHAYPAIRHTVWYLAQKYGIVPIEAQVPWPLPDEGALIDAYATALGAGARLLIVDHIFSPLGIVTPLEKLLPLACATGTPVLVDGAHAPAQIDLHVENLFSQGVTWYAGNAHKWLCAPKGCAFLSVGAHGLADLHPVVISNHFGKGLDLEFGWTGTRDPSAWLSVSSAIDFVESLGSARYRTALFEQRLRAGQLLAEAWGVESGAPQTMNAAMVALPLPIEDVASDESVARWRTAFLRESHTEVPVFNINGRHWVRLSAQVYNELTDFDPLRSAFTA